MYNKKEGIINIKIVIKNYPSQFPWIEGIYSSEKALIKHERIWNKQLKE